MTASTVFNYRAAIPNPGAAWPARWWAAALLLAMSLVIVLQHWHVMAEPLDQDIAGYAVLSQEMLHGRKLYSDLWERKPPAIFVTFAAAESITGYGTREIFLLAAVASVSTMLCLYRAGGIFSALLWALLSGDIWLAGDQPNAEVFVNLCLSGALAILLSRSPSIRRGLVVGLLFAAATLFKHHVVAIGAALLAAELWRRRSRIAVVDGLAAVIVIAVAWVGVFVYFAGTGRLSDFYSALFEQNFAYGASLWANLFHSLLPVNWFTPAMRWAMLPIALAVLWGIFGRAGRIGWATLGAYLLSAWIVVALPGYFWAHYYQLLLPPACVAGGWAASGLVGGKKRLPVVAVVVGLFAAEACWQWSNYRLSPEQISREKYASTDLPEQQAMGNLLGKVLLRGERFWELGEENEIYFAARRSPPSGLLYLEPLEAGPQRKQYADRLLADLVRSRPDAVILNSRWIAALPADSGILPWVKSEYVSDGGKLSRYTYRGFVRRGSDLARRLGTPES